MSAADAAMRGQSAAQAQFAATLAFYRPTGTTTDVDGYEVPAFTLAFTTPGKVQGNPGRDTTTRWVTVGDTERPVVTAGLHIPVSAPLPKVDYEAVCTAVDGGDESLVGRRWRVVDVPAKQYATARRLDVVEL